MKEERIEKKCALCRFCNISSEGELCFCSKKGPVDGGGKCKKFIFDPFKLSPRLPAVNSEFSKEDFKLV